MQFSSGRWQFDSLPMSAWPGLAAEGVDPARTPRLVLGLTAGGGQPAGTPEFPALWVRERDLSFHDLLGRLRSADPDALVVRLGAPTDIDHLRAIRHVMPRTAVVALVDEGEDSTLLHAVSRGADEALPTEQGDPLAVSRATRFAIARRARETALHRAAFTDPLTGALDERGLWALGPGLLAVVEAARRPIVALYADIDDLAATNAEFGEETGDTALCRVTWLLRETFPSVELLARAGDDEFFVITSAAPASLPRVDRVACSLDRLHADVEISVTLGTVSGPAATRPDLASLVRRARGEMASVKRRRGGALPEEGGHRADHFRRD